MDSVTILPKRWNQRFELDPVDEAKMKGDLFGITFLTPCHTSSVRTKTISEGDVPVLSRAKPRPICSTVRDQGSHIKIYAIDAIDLVFAARTA
jgi:hypothetical protein